MWIQNRNTVYNNNNLGEALASLIMKELCELASMYQEPGVFIKGLYDPHDYIAQRKSPTPTQGARSGIEQRSFLPATVG